jgi:ATP-dependent protease Clp ATPase subunit
MGNDVSNSKRKLGVCSFCNKTEDDVEKLIVANVGWYENLAICNQCVGLASDILEEDNEEHISTFTWLMRLGIKPKHIRKIVKK